MSTPALAGGRLAWNNHQHQVRTSPATLDWVWPERETPKTAPGIRTGIGLNRHLFFSPLLKSHGPVYFFLTGALSSFFQQGGPGPEPWAERLGISRNFPDTSKIKRWPAGSSFPRPPGRVSNESYALQAFPMGRGPASVTTHGAPYAIVYEQSIKSVGGGARAPSW